MIKYLVSISFFTLLCSIWAEPVVERIDPGSFAGFWEFQEPAGDTFIIIVKRGGDISGFWSGAGTSRIVRGEWVIEDEQLIARWESDHKDLLEASGENSLRRKSFEPGISIDSSPSHTARGTRVDPRRPGSLTVNRDPETRESELGSPEDPHTAPSIPLRNAFTGFWRVRQSTGFLGVGGAENPEFYLHLQRSGRAITALRGRGGDSQVSGRWRIDNEQAFIEWPDGSRDLLRDAGSGRFQLLHYRSRDVASGRPNSSRKAEKIDPSEGMRFFQAGDFQLLTVTDIRGIWRPIKEEDAAEQIEIEGWGVAYRTKAGESGRSESGSWRLMNDRVSITWVGGQRDVIRLTETGFILESYESVDQPQPKKSVAVGRMR